MEAAAVVAEAEAMSATEPIADPNDDSASSISASKGDAFAITATEAADEKAKEAEEEKIVSFYFYMKRPPLCAKLVNQAGFDYLSSEGFGFSELETDCGTLNLKINRDSTAQDIFDEFKEDGDNYCWMSQWELYLPGGPEGDLCDRKNWAEEELEFCDDDTAHEWFHFVNEYWRKGSLKVHDKKFKMLKLTDKIWDVFADSDYMEFEYISAGQGSKKKDDAEVKEKAAAVASEASDDKAKPQLKDALAYLDKVEQEFGRGHEFITCLNIIRESRETDNVRSFLRSFVHYIYVLLTNKQIASISLSTNKAHTHSFYFV